MDERRFNAVPLLAPLLLAGYFGCYCEFLSPDARLPGYRSSNYRCGGRISEAVFWQTEQLDRRLCVWNDFDQKLSPR